MVWLIWIMRARQLVSSFLSSGYTAEKRSSVSSVNDENHYSNGDSAGQSVMIVTMYVYTLSLLSNMTHNHHSRLQKEKEAKQSNEKEGNPLD